MTNVRQCGSCTLCCRLLPVKELGKGSDERCKHQRHTGCAIYATRPAPCRLWFCRWLLNDDGGTLSRPDRSHYVIDSVPDFVTLDPNRDGTEKADLPVLQIWCDPKHPEAHRDPALRRYLAAVGEKHGCAALVRIQNTAGSSGITLIPPCMSETGDFLEIPSDPLGYEHSAEQIAAVTAAHAAAQVEEQAR